MHVIGTAGHVDHGKTLLIQALTGINADRLPEEVERGMTIDLGFAHFRGSGGEPIGVIDVPGHERFIRNMVAGAWSLHLALLVVAADDGWMQQSSDHLQVIHAMGIPRLILTTTKTDRVSRDRIDEVEQEALYNIELITGSPAPAVSVSAATGENIDELKQMILTELSSVQPTATSYPRFCIDRVFTIKGAGTIVTGSLAGAALSKQDKLICLPSGREIKLRALQSYNEEVETANPGSRLALNIGNVKQEDLSRGDCITTVTSGFTPAKEFLFRLDPTGGEQRIKNHSEVEIALGTAHRLAAIHFYSSARLGRATLKDAVPVEWNQPFIVIRHGGSEILGSGRILKAGRIDRAVRKALLPLLAELPEQLADSHRIEIDLAAKGYLPRKEAEGVSDPGNGSTVPAGDWVLTKAYFNNLAEKIVKLVKQGGGVAFKELEGKTGEARELLQAVCTRLADAGQIAIQNNVVTLPGAEEANLSPFARNLIAQAKQSGNEGLEASKLKAPNIVKELKNLSKTGRIVSLDGNIFYHPHSYRTLVEKLVRDRNPGDRFSLGEAKDRTGLSRKYMIPLLNKMEQDGYVKRDENERVVLKTSVL